MSEKVDTILAELFSDLEKILDSIKQKDLISKQSQEVVAEIISLTNELNTILAQLP